MQIGAGKDEFHDKRQSLLHVKKKSIKKFIIKSDEKDFLFHKHILSFLSAPRHVPVDDRRIPSVRQMAVAPDHFSQTP